MTTTRSSDDTLDVEGPRFAMVPEWIIDAAISDRAFRLYAVLLRYGNTSGVRMPSRSTLARRLHKRSVDTVDRAMRELVELGAVRIERRVEGGVQLTNRYHVRTSEPDASSTAGRTRAAGGRSDAAPTGRSTAAGVAAALRPDPEPLTESTSPTPEELAADCRRLRSSLGLPTIRWSDVAVARALSRSQERGHSRTQSATALRLLASDPITISPLRVAEPGPWWDVPARSPAGSPDLDDLERELDAVDGLRAVLQQEARRLLTSRGQPLNRAAVVREAAALLRARLSDDGGGQGAPIRRN